MRPVLSMLPFWKLGLKPRAQKMATMVINRIEAVTKKVNRTLLFASFGIFSLVCFCFGGILAEGIFSNKIQNVL